MYYTTEKNGNIRLTGDVQNIKCGHCDNMIGKRNEGAMILYTKFNLIISDGKEILVQCGQCKTMVDVSKNDVGRLIV